MCRNLQAQIAYWPQHGLHPGSSPALSSLWRPYHSHTTPSHFLRSSDWSRWSESGWRLAGWTSTYWTGSDSPPFPRVTAWSGADSATAPDTEIGTSPNRSQCAWKTVSSLAHRSQVQFSPCATVPSHILLPQRSVMNQREGLKSLGDWRPVTVSPTLLLNLKHRLSDHRWLARKEFFCHFPFSPVFRFLWKILDCAVIL